MKITLDLDLLKEINLSPSEYCALIVIQKGNYLDYPIGDNILKSLNNKGFIDSNNKLISDIVTKKPDPIEEWVNLWPKHVINNSYRVSGSVPDCKTRMNTFSKRFPMFTWDIIMEATKRYLKRQEALGWKMTKKNYKFIYDRDGSMLAEECEALVRGEEDNQTNNIYL
jgi:hypothetical protein